MKCSCCGQAIKVEWPVKTVLYTHSSKDNLNETVTEALLEEGMDMDEVQEWFEKDNYSALYLGYEIEHTVELYEDGTSKLVGSKEV